MLLAIVPPLSVVFWLVAQTSGLVLGFWPTIVLVPLAMLAIALARKPAEEYLASSESPSGSSVPPGLVPFTLGYLAFHSKRAHWPVLVIVAVALGPIALLGIGWAALVILAFI